MEFRNRAGESNHVFRGDATQSDLETSPSAVSDAIQREIDKAQIREEILAAEMARRRELEAEVRRELMAEREAAAKVGPEKQGFSSYSSAVVQSESRLKLPMRYEPMIKAPKMERCGALALQSNTPAIQLMPQTTTAKEVNPTTSTPNGIKRKSVELATCVPSIKIKKWMCDLCNVSTGDENGLQAHMKGKKHKSKERSASSSVTHNSSEHFVPPGSLSSMQAESSNIVMMKNGDDAEVKVKKNEARVKCLCQVCKFETDNEKEIISHLLGQKHKNLIQENGGCVITISPMTEYDEGLKAVNGEKVEMGGNDEEVRQNFEVFS